MRFYFLFTILLLQVSVFSQVKTEEQFLVIKKDTLKGTLVLPDNNAKFDVIIIQPGSGPTNRNGNNPFAGNPNTYRLMANAFATQGLGTVLIDKRGVGYSTPAGKDESELRFNDYAIDLVAWVKKIKKDRRVSRVFIAGHSEGSLIGMIAAQKAKVSGYISISGLGENISTILSKQVKASSPMASAMFDSMLLRLKEKGKLDVVPPGFGAILRPSVQPYMVSWMAADPCTEIKKLKKIPVLILQGDNDVQVDAAQAKILQDCLPQAKLVMVQDMNHVLKISSRDRTENIASYKNPDLPVAPEVVEAIVAFVNAAGKH